MSLPGHIAITTGTIFFTTCTDCATVVATDVHPACPSQPQKLGIIDQERAVFDAVVFLRNS